MSPQRENRHTEGTGPGDHEAETEWPSTGRGPLAATGARTRPAELPEGANDADTLTLNFWPQNCEGKRVCCVTPPVCGHLLQQRRDLIHHPPLPGHGPRLARAQRAVCWEGRPQSTGRVGLAGELLQEPPKTNPVTRGGLAWVTGSPGAPSFSNTQGPGCCPQGPGPRPVRPGLCVPWSTLRPSARLPAPRSQKMLLAASPRNPLLRAESGPAIICASCICIYGHLRRPLAEMQM